MPDAKMDRDNTVYAEIVKAPRVPSLVLTSSLQNCNGKFLSRIGTQFFFFQEDFEKKKEGCQGFSEVQC